MVGLQYPAPTNCTSWPFHDTLNEHFVPLRGLLPQHSLAVSHGWLVCYVMQLTLVDVLLQDDSRESPAQASMIRTLQGLQQQLSAVAYHRI